MVLLTFIGLISLVALSYITTFIFHIYDDKFYNYFHLIAGILSASLFYNLFQNYFLALILTVALGILWEIFEWLQWKLLIKKKLFKPNPLDTRNDLFLDFIGGILGLTLLKIGLIY